MHTTRNNIVFYLVLVMLITLFLSRAALAISMAAFVVVALVSADWRNSFRTFITTPLLWGMSLLLLLPLVSGLWSEDQQGWLSSLRVKLPLLILPLGFAAKFRFSKNQWTLLAITFVGLVLCGTGWSMFHYLQSPGEFNEGYLRSETMPTPLGNDHVRFSWLTAMAVPVTGWLFIKSRDTITRWITAIVLTWLIVFLHILAARTGILAFYLFIFFLAIYFITKKTKPLMSAALLGLLVCLPVLAFLLVPSFQNRLKFAYYDFGYLRDAHYLPGGNDATRIISLKAGWALMLENPALGVGFGDTRENSDNWYAKHFSEIPPAERILPSNQWLIYGAGTGIPGFILFTIAILIPFFTRTMNRLAWVAMNVIIAFPFLYDIGLEIQYGVFIYCITLLLLWKWLKADAEKA